jgi:hypothetical protein
MITTGPPPKFNDGRDILLVKTSSTVRCGPGACMCPESSTGIGGYSRRCSASASRTTSDSATVRTEDGVIGGPRYTGRLSILTSWRATCSSRRRKSIAATSRPSSSPGRNPEPAASWDAMQSRPFREAARKAVEPVSVNGIDEVRFEHATLATPVGVKDDDLSGFDVPPEQDEELLDQVHDMNLRLVSVAFAEGNKWRVSDGEQTFFVTIEDEAFLARIEANEPFQQGRHPQVPCPHTAVAD